MANARTVSRYYLDGIRDGRAAYRLEGMAWADVHLDNLNRTIANGFDTSSPVGQMLRGERDFWLGQIRKGK